MSVANECKNLVLLVSWVWVMVETNTGAIKQFAIEYVVKRRDRLVVERLRLFRLKRAIDAYARTVDSELQECVEAGRELGAEIALPIWENVWKTSLREEMRRLTEASEWTRPEQTMRKSAYNPLSFDDVRVHAEITHAGRHRSAARRCRAGARDADPDGTR